MNMPAAKNAVKGTVKNEDADIHYVSYGSGPAVLTPPDPVSQAILAVPLLILYEMSIFLAKRVYPKPDEEIEAEAERA